MAELMTTLFFQFRNAWMERPRSLNGSRGIRHRTSRFSHAFVTLVLGLAGSIPAFAAPDVDDEIDVRAILTRHCLKCHGPTKQSGGLRLDDIQAMRDGGDSGPAIQIEEPEASLLLRAVRREEDVSAMPPEGEPLSSEEIATLTRWVRAGAPGKGNVVSGRVSSDHWSFQPVKKVTPPDVRNQAWVRNPIDAFILSRLEKDSLSPSREASKETLIRRLSLDLIGLPPSPEEVEAFLLDNRPDAFEQLVERLLASPHHGERWGRIWLDAARYADSNGYTIDGPREIWRYRDWVIDALNQDMSFHQFTIEQLAGDLLPNATLAQRVATGFHRNTMINEEGGTDDEQFRVEAVVDRVSTTGEVFLGLTLGCAQCHSHKFDPITHREFYRFFAFFNNCDEPSLEVPTPEQEKIVARVRGEVAKLEKQVKEREDELLNTYSTWLADRQASLDRWVMVAPASALSQGGATLATQADQSILAAGMNAKQDVYTLVVNTDIADIAGFRLEALTDDRLPAQGPGRAGNGNFVLGEFAVSASPIGDPTARKVVPLQSALADHSQPEYPVEHAIDGNEKTGWAINTASKKGANVPRTALFLAKESVGHAEGTTLVFTLSQRAVEGYNLGRFRLSLAQSGDRPPALIPSNIAAILQTPPEQRTDDQAKLLREQYFGEDDKRKSLLKQIAVLRKQIPGIAKTLVVAERAEVRDTFVHLRGDFLRKGAKVEPGVPSVLPPLKHNGRANRLDLAHWLVSEENPLTARVTVNRFWQQYFGMGIVETDNDFGTQGTPPAHPELLDWLANEFMSRGWSMKQLHRLIVTSATYRQSSDARFDLMDIDPRNLLLARQNRLRLDAEVIRDTALAVGGRLSRKIGGPSVFPHQPDGVMALAQVNRPWNVSKGDDQYRRGLYTYFWRSTPHPFLKVFDAPDAQRACTRRNRSNTPLQSLTLLNDAAFMECADALATRVVNECDGDDVERLRHAFRLALGRRPLPEELDILATFLAGQRAERKSEVPDLANEDEPSNVGTGSEAGVAVAQSPRGTTPDPDSDGHRRAWIAAARVLLNLDEFITRE